MLKMGLIQSCFGFAHILYNKKNDKIYGMFRRLTFIKFLPIKLLKKFKSLSLKKKIVVVTILIIIVIIASQIYSNATRSPQYITVLAQKADIIEVVSETGSISTNSRTDVYSPANGIVENILAKNGDKVSVGQELLTVKSTATQQEKAQALANYLADKNALESASATLYTLRSKKDTAWKIFYDLSKSSTYENSDDSPKETERNSSADFQSKQADWLAAEANYKNQQTSISKAQAALSGSSLAYQATQNGVIKATADGVISNLSVTVGSSVKVNSLSAPVMPLVTIASLSTTEAVVSLSENDISKVREGQKASLDISALQNKIYQGIVRRVDAIGTEIQGVIRYNVYIEVLDPQSSLRPGMSVDAKITTKELSNVLSLPNSAVKPYQGGRGVRVPGKNGEIKYIPVEAGIRGDERTQILKGVEEGQEVITSLSNEQIKRPGLFGN